MSKILFYRRIDQFIAPSQKQLIERVFQQLDEGLGIAPKHIHACKEGTLLSIYNPSEQVQWQGLNLEINPGKSLETRSLAINVEEDRVRITTGKYTTQIYWYYKDQNQFIFSNSQWMMNQLIDGFQLNEEAAKWMISTGCTAMHAWDNRVQPLSYGSEIDITEGRLNVTHSPPHFYTPSNIEPSLEETLDHAFNDYELSPTRGILTLSGGFDSRVLLHKCLQEVKVDTISWGMQGADLISGTDSNVAKTLAINHSLNHSSVAFDLEKLDASSQITKMTMAGDMRIDHVNQFMDGLQLYVGLLARGKETVIRGDEAFGWVPVSNRKDTLMSVGINQIHDYSNVSENMVEFHDNTLHLIRDLNRTKEESLEAWRDRLYVSFRLPFVISALHDQMTPFVDVINPFLHPSIIEKMRSISDQNRTGKAHFRNLYSGQLAHGEIARYPAVPEPGRLLTHPAYVELMKNTLSRLDYDAIFKQFDLSQLLQKITVSNFDNSTILNSKGSYDVSRWLPFGLKKFLRNRVIGYSLSINRLAFRLALVQLVKDEFGK